MGLLMASNIIWSLLGHSVGYYPLVGEILDTAVVEFCPKNQDADANPRSERFRCTGVIEATRPLA